MNEETLLEAYLTIKRATEVCEESMALLAEAQQILDHVRTREWERMMEPHQFAPYPNKKGCIKCPFPELHPVHKVPVPTAIKKLIASQRPDARQN